MMLLHIMKTRLNILVHNSNICGDFVFRKAGPAK